MGRLIRSKKNPRSLPEEIADRSFASEGAGHCFRVLFSSHRADFREVRRHWRLLQDLREIRDDGIDVQVFNIAISVACFDA